MKDQKYNIDIIVSTTLPTIERLAEFKNGGDAILLYFKYIKQSRIQETNQSWSTDKFMMQGLKWSKDKFAKAKKILKELGLVENIQSFKDNGQFDKTYVKVNFIIQNTRYPENTDTVKTETNAGSKVIEMLKEKKLYTHSSEGALLQEYFGKKTKQEICSMFENKKTVTRIVEIIKYMEQIIKKEGEIEGFEISIVNINRMDILMKDKDYLDEFLEIEGWHDFPYCFGNILRTGGNTK